MDWKNSNTVYFLGIGGIGMSALARYFQYLGKAIHGYDLTPSPLTLQLEKEGMTIHYREDISQIPATIDFVVYTPAIPSKNAELNYFKEKNIPLFKRSEITGLLSDEYFTVAIAGTHGKTSMSAIAAQMLKMAGKNITALIGGIMNPEKTNVIISEPTELFLIEADEFDRSFLRLSPDIGVISSIDADHLDIYKDKSDLQNNFKLFAEKINPEGVLILNDRIADFISADCKTVTYGLMKNADIRAKNIHIENGKFIFDIEFESRRIDRITMNIPGNHYVENACAAAAIGFNLGLNDQQIREGLEKFRGVERRFEFRINTEKIVYVDDYAHHPEEIRATIKAIKTLFPAKKITGIFQPHLFSRTRDFYKEFAESLMPLDEVILLPIYPAREEPLAGVTSGLIYDEINGTNKILLSKKDLPEYLEKAEIGVLVTLGAGDIGLMPPVIENILLSK